MPEGAEGVKVEGGTVLEALSIEGMWRREMDRLSDFNVVELTKLQTADRALCGHLCRGFVATNI